MLKYIGDFDKLKNYGFTQSLIKDLLIKSASQGKSQIIVIKKTREIHAVYDGGFGFYGLTSKPSPLRYKVIKQLIKDGLVIKEEE